MAHSVKIELAGTVFRFFSDEAHPISFLKKNYSVFMSDKIPDIRVTLRLSPGWSRKISRTSKFSLASGGGTLTTHTRYFDAFIDFKTGAVVISAGCDVGMTDVARFLCSVLLMRRGGFLLHASSVIHKNAAYIFFGPSGSGKTTVARLSPDTILSDETTAVSLDGGCFLAHATPFSGEFDGVRYNRSARVKAVFLLRKDTRFHHNAMSSRSAIRDLFASVMMPPSDRGMTEKLFAIFETLVSKVPCYELYFRPDKKIWRYIDEHFGYGYCKRP